MTKCDGVNAVNAGVNLRAGVNTVNGGVHLSACHFVVDIKRGDEGDFYCLISQFVWVQDILGKVQSFQGLAV